MKRKTKSNYVSVEDFFPISAKREDLEKTKAILMDISAEIATLRERELKAKGFSEKEAEKWFEEIAEAIREI